LRLNQSELEKCAHILSASKLLRKKKETEFKIWFNFNNITFVWQKFARVCWHLPVLFILGWLHLNFKNKLGLTPQKEAEMHLFFSRLDFCAVKKKRN